ncbi:right-handed parallel beta-helix repeat-containing protein [Pseudofrankia sp. DC12]|uniref:right-handed parallel beta-helix repeat-containing protein n=1 Tax=Pseudofrankia sp. DC12 TaxID=683315 RepID=UPI0005F7CF60|nr:right-handed parallel beta-helix repeat-containing protein [Pseudofrankia sp. DC12]
MTGPSRRAHEGTDQTETVRVPVQRSGTADEVGGGAARSGGARRAAARAARATAAGTRGRGVYLLVTVMTLVAAGVLTVTVGRHYQGLASTSEFFHRHAYTPSYDPISNVEGGLQPNTIDTRSSRPDPSIRAISISPAGVDLLVGGQVRHSFPLRDSVTALPQLASVVNDPDWLEYDGKGHAVLHAALVVVGQTSFTIDAPVTSLVLESRRGVLLGAESGTLAIDGVSIRPSAPNPDPEQRAVDQRQPFIVAASRSQLIISHSHLSTLGRDWNSSYGVSWTDGASGSITNSEVDHTFIATYTDAAHDVTIANNWLHDNALYGVDPHSSSTRIVVRQNLSEHNGRHGIIFSDNVTDSVVEDNVARDNYLNGIMMDAESTGNRIVGNSVTGNRGDGLVLASSPNNLLADNTVTHNRIGVMVRGDGGDEGVTLRGNEISGNQLASQGISLAGNKVSGNGDTWLPRRLAVIWSPVPVTIAVLIGLTRRLRRRRGRAAGRGRHSSAATIGV